VQVYETFGPTSQPFYQVKFPSISSVDEDVVKVSRLVFHVPGRSKFVFPSQLKALKGSDASNFYDEEVPEDEAEFSDDEKEAAFKAARRKRYVTFVCSIYT
jgi:H/ACA ribonucleoprotein complex non-core subunit NAF1